MCAMSGEVAMCVSTMGKNKCESWNHFGVIFKPEGGKSLYCNCFACHQSKVMSDSMMCIIKNGIILHYMILYNPLFAQCNYTKQ